MMGEQIQIARKSRGWSLEFLSAQIGRAVTKQALHKYEQGKDAPGSSVLLKLSEAFGVGIDYFFRDPTVAVQLGELHCRKRTSVGARKLAQITAQAKESIEARLAIESLFPAERFPKFKMPPPDKRRVETLEDVETVAMEVRKSLNLGLDAIENMTELLEDIGVKVFQWAGDEAGFDGFACWANHSIPVIVTRASLPGDRQRSNLAHELGHLIMEVSPSIDSEKAAKRFSAAFLVPKPTAQSELSSARKKLALSELQQLKQKYGMSMQQWIYRAKDLGIISPALAQQYFMFFRRSHCHKEEPGASIPPEKSTRFGRIALQAVSEGILSPARAAELTGLSLQEFRPSPLSAET